MQKTKEIINIIGIIGYLSIFIFLGTILQNSIKAEDKRIEEKIYRSIDYNYIDKVVYSIYLAEGGKKATYPFGVKVKRTLNVEEAKETCTTLITKYYVLWIKNQPYSGKDFIKFLQVNYAPKKSVSYHERKLNENWEKNVKYFLTKNLTNWQQVLNYESERNRAK